MTENNGRKELLYREMCRRMPYDVEYCEDDDHQTFTLEPEELSDISFDREYPEREGEYWYEETFGWNNAYLMLRPMSDVTSYEKEQIKQIIKKYGPGLRFDSETVDDNLPELIKLCDEISRYADSRMLDYNDCIVQKLAFDSTKHKDLYRHLKKMKIEKTCKCIKDCTLSRTKDENSDKFEFKLNHEYQVDWLAELSESTFKVYKNGGWDDYAVISQEEFEENFKMID